MVNKWKSLLAHDGHQVGSVRFKVGVIYGQVAVFDPNIDRPFNDWTPEHVAQGFAWRPGSVSFKTLYESGVLLVETRQTREIKLSPNAERSIVVPFDVGGSGLVEIGSIDRGERVQVPAGRYALLFQTGFVSDAMWCSFTFTRNDSAQADVLRADPRLSPSYPLLMKAAPA